MSTFHNDKITEDVCPFCGAKLEWEGEFQSDDDYIFIESECPSCHAGWTDFYTADNQDYWSCPSCGSHDVEVEQVQVDGNIAWCDVSCVECSEGWTENFSYEESEKHY